jgi:hypothetical protein
MRNRFIFIYLLLLVLFVIPVAASAQQDAVGYGKNAHKQTDVKKAPAPPAEVENWSVLNDIKTGLHPIDAVVVTTAVEPDYVRELVRVQWRAADPINLWVMRPKTPEKVPVILYLYSYPTEDNQFRNDGWAKRAVTGGYAAVGFVSALTGQRFQMRPIKQTFVTQLPESLGSTVHDVQLILNYLEGRGDLDTDHVGMFGMGSGGTIAILAARVDKRIKSVDVLDPWGDWPDWLKETPDVSEEDRPKLITSEFLKSVENLDPVVYLPSMRVERVHIRLQQTLSEQLTPKDAKDRIASSVADPGFVTRYADTKTLMDAWQAKGLSGWLKDQLHSQVDQDRRDAGLDVPAGDASRN